MKKKLVTAIEAKLDATANVEMDKMEQATATMLKEMDIIVKEE